MASEALHLRLRVAERQLTQLKQDATALSENTARLEQQIEALRRSLGNETSARAEDTAPDEAPRPARVVPPPLPSQPVHSTEAPKPAPQRQSTEALPASPTKAAPTPAPSSPTPTPAARAALPEAPPKENEGFEIELGRVWFVRIGIGLLLTGFVFLSTYAYQNYIVNWGPGSRVAALYTAAVCLAATGFFLERWKESLRNYGRVVAAGGWAAIYYTTYAVHHVERLRLVESPVLAAILLSLVALAFFAYAASRKSSVLTVAALALAFYATAINPIGWLGCFSSLLLSAIGVFFFLRFRWLQTGIASLAGAYLSYVYWQFFVDPGAVSTPTRWFLAGYWLLFTTAVLAPQARKHAPNLLAGIASANNILFFVLFSFDLPALSWVPDLSTNALVFGGLLLAIAIFLGRRRDYPPLLCNIFLAKGLALVTWGLSLELSGYHLFLTLTLEALVLAFLWRKTKSPILRTFVWIAAGVGALVAAGGLTGIEERAPDLAYLTDGLLLALLAILMRGKPWMDEKSRHFSAEATVASALALAIASIGMLAPLPTAEAGLWLLGTGLALWAAYLAAPTRWPLPELAWLAQGSAGVGVLMTLAGSPGLAQLGLLTAGSALAFQLHGWSLDRKRHTVFPQASQVAELGYVILFLLSLAFFIVEGVETPGPRLLLFALVPLAGHFYGSFLGRPIVAALAQLFYLPVFALSALAWNPDFVDIARAPSQLDALGAFLLAVAHLTAVHLLPSLKFREIFRESHLAIASVLWTGWCVAFIEPSWLVLAWTGCALFFLPHRFQAKFHSAAALTFLAIALAGISFFESGQFWLRYLALPAPFLIQFLEARRDAAAGNQDRPLWTGLAAFVLLAVTVIASQHTLELFDGRGLAICWAIVALASFGIGLASHERVYRLGGLALLAFSLGHLLLIDVWKLDTILRILSFITVGLALLALSFIYNRWHESLRKFL